MSTERLDRRLAYLESAGPAVEPSSLRDSPKAEDYVKMMEQARAMMDSPVKRAFDYAKNEKPATLDAYEPKIARGEVQDKSYYYGRRFGHGLLLARRLVESGARFVQVEYQYGPFRGFDMHEDGQSRMVEMKKQIDGPIAQLIRDLAERGLLERTLVVVATEFGRTIANQPKAGVEPIGFAEAAVGRRSWSSKTRRCTASTATFSSANSLLFFGGGFKPGCVYGRTADRHPMLPIENPVDADRRPRHDLQGPGHPRRHPLRHRRPPVLRDQGRQGEGD